MMNLQQLTTFVTVISEGSMTAAADKLYLTQPAVSQQIRNLEEELGVELLVRGVRQIKPSPQGEVLYEHAKKIIQHVNMAETAIKTIGAELKGDLKVGTLNSIGLHLMSPIISRLLRHNPDLRLSVEYGHGPEIIQDFKKGNFDIIILPNMKSEYQQTLEGVEEKFLMREEMWLVAPGKDSSLPREVSADELGGHSLVYFVDEFPEFNNRLVEAMGEPAVDEAIVFQSSNVGTLKRVIETGLGWGFLPSHSIRKQVRSGRLFRVHVKDFEYQMEFMFYSKKSSSQKALIDIFFQTLSQEKA